MSVVAGCSLFDGVLLAADCRVTIRRSKSPKVYADNVQKLFPIYPGTAIGFVGDLDVASYLLKELLTQVRRRLRKDPVSLANWMPRLFKSACAIFASRKGPRSIVFMVASVLKDRPNVVDRETVAELVKYIGFGKSPVQRNWMPGILVEILKTPDKYRPIAIPGTSRGILYVMRSPSFEVEHYRPLQFAAIGSGESTIEEIARYHDAILALEPGNSFVEALQFREAIRRFVEEKKIRTVGGLYPALKVTGRGTELLGYSTQIPVGGTKIELTIEAGRWIQRNLTTGKEIKLLLPWEIQDKDFKDDLVFEDLKEAYRRFRGEN